MDSRRKARESEIPHTSDRGSLATKHRRLFESLSPETLDSFTSLGPGLPLPLSPTEGRRLTAREG